MPFLGGPGPTEPDRESEHCDFCSKPSDEVAKLFGRPDSVHICNECLDVCHDIILDFEENPPIEAHQDEDDILCLCSFCGRNPGEVKQLIAGPTVNICNDCVEQYRKTFK